MCLRSRGLVHRASELSPWRSGASAALRLTWKLPPGRANLNRGKQRGGDPRASLLREDMLAWPVNGRVTTAFRRYSVTLRLSVTRGRVAAHVLRRWKNPEHRAWFAQAMRAAAELIEDNLELNIPLLEFERTTVRKLRENARDG